MSRLKIALVAASGSGKSTAAGFIVSRLAELGLTAGIYKLAQPLYEIQASIYRRAGREIELYQQDQALLETIASEMRRINPESLVQDFLRRIAEATEDVIVNDDLRDSEVDYPALRAEGFQFVKISAQRRVRLARLHHRQDLASLTRTPLDDAIECIEPNWLLVNDSSQLDHFAAGVHHLVDRLVEIEGR